ncbi:MAG: DUF2442 domain-containing protein [Gemmatimonadota bacterium]
MAKPARSNNNGFEQENETAVREAREADRIEPRANSVRYDAQQGLLLVELRSGFVFGFPPERVFGLEDATAKQLATVRISPSGDGLHWDDLNVDASLTGLMADALNLREWAPRLMGQARSEAKARAARLNGMKGGRPRRAAKPKKSSRG